MRIPAEQFIEVVDAAGDRVSPEHRELAAKLRRQTFHVELTPEAADALSRAASEAFATKDETNKSPSPAETIDGPAVTQDTE